MKLSRHWDVVLLWEPRDLWVGVFWDWLTVVRTPTQHRRILCIYVCLLPCLPLRFRRRP